MFVKIFALIVLNLVLETTCQTRDENFWKNVNYLRDPLPKNLPIDQVILRINKLDVAGFNVRYRIADPPAWVKKTDKVLFLLHGAAFTSANWETRTREPDVHRKRIDTMVTLAAVGHQVISVDLPGSRQRQTTKIRGAKRTSNEQFLAELIKSLAGQDQKVVLVSPSASGSFSIPLLLSYPDLLCGFIPVAPGGTGPKEKFADVKVPTMIVVGENDSKRSSNNLAVIPTSSQLQILPDAGHPAYLDQPDLWHQLIYNFMNLVEC